MAGSSEATKALNRVARERLRPRGLKQKGQSRTWLDDHGWWVVVIEFQPSSFAKGSYLNVGACWLWWPWFRTHLSFDAGYRVESFVSFRSEDEFDAVAADLVDKAQREVDAMRKRFATAGLVLDYLDGELRSAPMNPWDIWSAAMGLALVGRADDARRVAGHSPPAEHMPDWETKLRRELASFSAMDEAEMQVAVRANIHAARSSLRLGAWDEVI